MQTCLLKTVCILLFTVSSAFAHVGSPDVFYEGDAGPYHLFITVRMPQVIPGVAGIQVRSRSNDVRLVRLVVLTLTGPGSNLPPTPDLAEESKQDPQLFVGNLWLMQSGALQVRVMVEGSKGRGEVSIPVPSFAQRTFPMQKPLAAVLIGLMLFLAGGLVSIVSASVRLGSLEPGQVAAPSNLRRSRLMIVITMLVVVATLCFGRAWWNAEARDYQRSVDFFKPPAAEVTLENQNRLLIRARDQGDTWHHQIKLKELVPDHNHLMHLFLIRLPGLDCMWHLHPDLLEAEQGVFAQELPSMPRGHYQVFADVVDKSGFPWTLVGKFDLSYGIDKPGPLSGDDSSWIGAPFDRETTKGPGAGSYQLPDGGRIVWQRDTSEPLRANTAIRLQFAIMDKDGNPAQDVEPYMSMAGHAELVRSDLSVFAHIHPAGSVSMAALELASTSPAVAPAAGHDGVAMPMPAPSLARDASAVPLPSQVSFPYGFPQPGDYRIFVQVKRAGRVQTAAFDAHVQ